MKQKILALLVALATVSPFAFATGVEEITEPLNKIYDLIKAIVTLVALIALTYAGGRLATSGDNIQAREGAKSMITYCIAGLVMVWVAPLVVSFLTPAAP
ncbi:MAG: pilin [Candidatus Micrarchaeota archaeon]